MFLFICIYIVYARSFGCNLIGISHSNLYTFYLHSVFPFSPPLPSPPLPLYLPPPPFINHRVRKQIVNVPSFVVRLDSQKHIDYALTSPFGGGREGRVKRKNAKKAAGGGGSADEDED